MTATADRHRVLRGAIECAIRLAPGTRDRQTGPLTTTVWRVVEPALAQRDAQLDAVRALHHDWPNDPGHCAHCQDGMGTPLTYPCPTIRALDVRRPPAQPRPRIEGEHGPELTQLPQSATVHQPHPTED